MLTFYPQWQSLHKPDFKYLLPQADKIAFLEKLSVDEMISVPCDAEFAGMAPEAFIDDVLVGALDVCGVVVGFNFSFGHEAQGHTGDAARTSDAAGRRGACGAAV